jgi:predicted glycogen debranching enzyme
MSLPGLCLATGRAQEAGEILTDFAARVENDFSGRPLSAGADAYLWYVWAAQGYLRATQDEATLKKILPALRRIVDAYEHGTAPGVRMQEDGLLDLQSDGAPLTWMNLRIKDGKPAPRNGKPVEIQALWYNALQFLAEMDLRFKEPGHGYEKLAQVAQMNFNEKFWNPAQDYLFDLADGKERDATLRPNAILSISLPYEILDQKYFKPVLTTAWRRLYTSFGLRTLAPEDPAYGQIFQTRDERAPQGAVWPWLLGPFITAFVKAFGASDQTKEEIHRFLRPFQTHLNDDCLSFVAELFEGQPPHAAMGAPAKALSVGELLRVIWEEKLAV